MGDRAKRSNHHRGHKMLTNLDRFKKDLDSLITKGQRLRFAMQSECWPQHFEEWLRRS